MHLINKITYLVMFIILGMGVSAYAQGNVHIDEVTKIELVYRIGGLGDDQTLVEVIAEKGQWNAYQSKLVNYNETNVNRLLIKTISLNQLKDLLIYLQKPDTLISIELFDIDINQLKEQFEIDNDIILSVEQKNEVMRAFQDKNLLNKAVEKVLTPFLMDDRSFYSITVTTKNGKVLKAEALNFATSYHLPWTINGYKSYNPNIALIFENIFNRTTYPTQQKQSFSRQINSAIYNENFRARFNWENLKSDQPRLAEIFEPTLSASNLSITNNSISGYFKSSLLPKYVLIHDRFEKNNIQKIQEIKRYEDTLVNVFKRNNFLFDYLKSKDIKLIFTVGKMARLGDYYLESIRKVYPEIDQFITKDIQFLEVLGESDSRSIWMLLPNNTLLLLQYTGVRVNQTIRFMNFDPSKFVINDVIRKNVCMLFDRRGNLIKDYGRTNADVSYN